MRTLLLASFVFMATAAQAATYNLDTAHSVVGFSVKHLMVSNVKGQFNKFEGSFNFDEKKNEVSSVVIKVDPASIDTANAKRDDHLRSPDFFDVKKYPEMNFKSDKPVTVKQDQPVKITGDLTMHGVTKPVTLELTYNGSIKDPQGTEKVGFSLAGKISRKDWGLTWNKTLDKGGVAVSDEVKVQIEGEANKAK